MYQTDIKLSNGKTATGYIVELGPVNLVFAKTENLMIACGAFDVQILDKFNFPAAKIKALQGSIATIEDLLSGKVVEANKTAIAMGLKEDITGQEALEMI